MSVAPQVDVPILGRVLQARPQEPPEVYSNLLPPSVGETTGGIHPMPSGINISAPPEVNVPYSWVEDCRHIRRSHRRYTQIYTRRGGDSTAGSYPNGKRLAKLCATATGGIHPPLGKRVSAPQVIVLVAPQVDVPNSWAGIAGTSAGATGGILKRTPAECRRNHRRYTPPCRQA